MMVAEMDLGPAIKPIGFSVFLGGILLIRSGLELKNMTSFGGASEELTSHVFAPKGLRGCMFHELLSAHSCSTSRSTPKGSG